MARRRGWLFEDHFNHGHIQFEVGAVMWSKPFDTYADAAREAHRFGFISAEQMRKICDPQDDDDDYERKIVLEISGKVADERFARRGYIRQPLD